MANTVVTNNKQYKRQDRSVSPETAQKISNSLKSYNATHPRNPEWCHGYWQQIQPKKTEDGDGTTMDDLVL